MSALAERRQAADGCADYRFPADPISESDLARLCGFVHSVCGVHLPPDKRELVEGRLRRRLRALSLNTYSAYCSYLFSDRGRRSEPAHLIDALTTNTTEFFRENRHFEFMVSDALPALTSDQSRPLLVWSSACSSGEEPYTLAMVLSEYAQQNPGFSFRIRASDISHTILEKARLGVYAPDSVASIPANLLQKYFMRSRDQAQPRFRAVPEIRETIEFRHCNLMEQGFGFDGPVDLLFCRNVLIYFTRETQHELLRRMVARIRPGGYLFLGHSESLSGLDLKVSLVAPTVYRKPDV